MRFERKLLPVNRFRDGADFRDYFKRCYGPTIAVYRSMRERGVARADLDAALASLGDEAIADFRRTCPTPAGRAPLGPVMPWEYLLVTARRR